MNDQNPEWMNDLTERERKEIEFCLVYADQFNHGTDGHTRLLIVAKLAKKLNEKEAAE
jgi:hypothetical protein